MLISRAQGVPGDDFKCILLEILCLKGWGTSQGLQTLKQNSKKYKIAAGNVSSARPSARAGGLRGAAPREDKKRGVQGAAPPG